MDLQPVIIEYLCRQRALSLPGLGTLRWLESKPKRSSDLIFKGPSFSLHHSNKEGSPSDFVDYLSKKAKVTTERSTSIIDEWSRSVLADIKDSQEVRIGGLGAYYEEEGRLVFKADQIALQQGGDLSLSLANRDRPVPVMREMTSTNGNAFRIWDILLPLILIALILLLSLSIWKSLKPENGPGLDPVSGIEKVEKTEEAEVTKDESAEGTPKGDSSENTETGEIDAVEGESDKDPVKDINDGGSPDDGYDQGEINEVNGVDDDAEGVNEDYIEEDVENGEEGKIVSRAKEGECIVIIGSFKRSDLADLAVQRVMDRGLNAYTEAYGEFTRVGVVFDCETQDLYRRLFQLRGDFGNDAWILKYK